MFPREVAAAASADRFADGVNGCATDASGLLSPEDSC